MKMTAEGMHALADMIRHPEKFGAAAEQIVNGAIGKLGELAKGASELATAAKEQMPWEVSVSRVTARESAGS